MYLRIKPRCQKRGYSWGFDWPLQYGYDSKLDAWLVWDHNTGEIEHVFPSERNHNGFNFAEGKARNASAPEHDPAMNAMQDSVS